MAMAEPRPTTLDTPWRQLSSRTVYRHPFLTVREDQVALPDGQEVNYCVATTGASGVCVGVLPFLDESTVVLERQWRYIVGRATWEMPTGGVNPGEDLAEAAQRELMEEVGYRAGILVPLLTFSPSKSVVDETAHLYLAAGLRPERLPADATEFIERHPVPFDDVVDMVEGGEVQDAMTIAAVLLAARLRDRGRLARLLAGD
jgi:ADP-ribose pyrophosphatase